MQTSGTWSPCLTDNSSQPECGKPDRQPIFAEITEYVHRVRRVAGELEPQVMSISEKLFGPAVSDPSEARCEPPSQGWAADVLGELARLQEQLLSIQNGLNQIEREIM